MSTYRNGTRPHQLINRVEILTLRVPRLRNGSFSTEMFARYQLREQAAVLTTMEMVVNGVSTCKISQTAEQLCGTEFSKSTVLDLCKKLDPLVNAWNNRDLGDMGYPFLLMDALPLKVREEGRIRCRGVMIATGTNTKGYREGLGLMLGDNESKPAGASSFAGLKAVTCVVWNW